MAHPAQTAIRHVDEADPSPPKAHDEIPKCKRPQSSLSFDRVHITDRDIQNIGLLFLHRGWFARALLDKPSEPLRSKYR